MKPEKMFYYTLRKMMLGEETDSTGTQRLNWSLSMLCTRTEKVIRTDSVF